MKVVRKGKEIKIDHFNREELLEFLQRRDKLIYNCELCGKEVSKNCEDKRLYRFGFLCRNCCTKKTNLEKYGVENVFQSKKIKEKIKETNLKKYGVEHPQQNNSIREKTEENNLKKYGEKNVRNVNFVKEKIKETNLKKYGVEHPMMDKKIADKASFGIIKKRFKDLKSLNLNEVSPLFNLENYNGNSIDNKYKWKCNKCGNIFEDHIYAGRIPRCPKCFGSSSKAEKEILEFVKKYTRATKKRFNKDDTDKRKKYELDIFIKEKNIGIEYNGLYWHTELKKGKNYHLDKTKFFNNIGIKLVHIFEDEWINKKDIVKSIILSKLNIFDEAFYARKCVIKNVPTEEEILFLENNHIQGYTSSSICYGLYFNDELVSIMSFIKSRFNKNYEYELLRFANKINAKVAGGASRLFKHFEKNFSNKSIVSYCDLRYFNGRIYELLGFDFIRNSDPNYYYTEGHYKKYNRMKFQKHKLKNLLENFDPKLTEYENMLNNGYDRIWDCGNGVWGKNINKNEGSFEIEDS